MPDNQNQEGPTSNGPHDESMDFLDKILAPFVIFGIFLREPSVFLRKRSYEVNPFWKLAGYVGSFGAAIYEAYSLGYLHHTWWLWVGVIPVAIWLMWFYYLIPLVAWGLELIVDPIRNLWKFVAKFEKKWLTKLLQFGTVMGYVALAFSARDPIVQHLNIGDFGYLIWFVLGALLFAVISLGVTFLRLPFIAGLTGVAAVAYAHIHINPLLPSVPYIPAALEGWLLQGLEWFAWYVVVFPLSYLFVAGLGGWINAALEWVFERLETLLDAAYLKFDEGFQLLFAHVVNIVVAVVVGFGVFHYALQFGLEQSWSLALAPIAALIAYGQLGRALPKNNIPIGLGSGLLAGAGAYYCASIVLGFGLILSGAITAVIGFGTFLVVFPLAYLGLESVGKSAAPLGVALADLHKSLTEELFDAFRHTYKDETPYRPVFAQIVNLSVIAMALYAIYNYAGLALVPAMFGGMFVVLIGYALGGEVLSWKGNHIVGGIASIVVGVKIGTMLFATGNGLWTSAGEAFLAACVNYGLVFPVAYVLLRAFLVHVVRVNGWLSFLIVGVYDWYAGIWAEVISRFLVLYAQVRTRFYASYARTWKNVQDRVNKIRNRRGY